MDYPRYLYIGQPDEKGNIPGVVVFAADEEAEKIAAGYRRDPQEKTEQPTKRKPGRPRKQ